MGWLYSKQTKEILEIYSLSVHCPSLLSITVVLKSGVVRGYVP